jgi:acyl carrier protein
LQKEKQFVIEPPVLSRRYVAERAKQLLHEIAKVPLEDITEDATFDTSIVIESVQLVELVVALEDEFGTELDPLEMIERNRFADIVDYIYDRAREAQRATA